MKTNKILLILIILILISTVNIISAKRMPIPGADDGTWSTILNEFLNVSHNDTGELRNDTVSSLQILNGTIIDADISDITNLTLGEKITFTLGGIIDNIINGWIEITGGLNVRGQGNFSGTVYINNATDISTWETNVSRNWTLDTYNSWNTDWLSTYNATYLAINLTSNIQGLLNSTGIYSTYNATYAKYAANVSRNWTQQTYDNWNAVWSAGGGDFSFTDFHASFVLNSSILNNTANIQNLLNSTGIYSTYNATYAKYAANVSRNYTQQTYDNWNAVWSAGGGTGQWGTDGTDIYNKTAKVGIGTDSPSQKLDVRGQGNFSGTIWINNDTDISTWITNVSRNWTQQTYDNWGENWYNHTLSTYNLWNTDWLSTYNATYFAFNTTSNLQGLLNSTGIYSTYNATYLAINTTANIQNLLNSTGIYSTYNATYAKYAANVSRNYTQQTYDNWGENWYNHTLATYTAYNSDWISTYNATYAKYAANVSRNYTQQTYDNWGENWYNHTLSTYTIYDSRWYQVLWDATFNASFDDRDSDTTYSDLSEFNDNIFAGINHTLQTYTHWNSDWISTYNATYLAINTTANIQNLLNSTGIYSTYNATYAKYAANVSRNYTQQTYDNWNAVWSAGGGTGQWGTDGTDIYNKTAKVGIGTDSPSQKLDVRGQGNFSGTIWINNDTDISTWITNVSRNWTQQTYDNWNAVWSAGGGTGQWGTDGTDIYNKTAKVGIGTDSPSQKLDVRGQGNFSGTIWINNDTDISTWITNVSRNWTQQTYDNWNAVWSAGGGTGQWGTDGTDIYNKTAKVGIGTDSPSQKLDVRGQGNFSGTIWINNDTDISTWITNVSRNWTQQTYDNWNAVWSAGGGTGQWGTDGTDIYNKTAKVGIGTDSPSQKLDVRGQGNFSGTIWINNDTDISTWITNVSRNWTQQTYDNWNAVWSAGGGTGQWGTDGTDIYNKTAKVGIGTDSPSQKLDVRGQGNFSGTIWINNDTDISTWITNVSRNWTQQTYDNWGENWYNHTLSTYNLWNTDWLSTYNATYFAFNTTSNLQGLLNSTGIYSTYNATYLAINTTANIQNLLNSTGIYSTYNATYAKYAANVSRNYTQQTYDNWGENWYNHTLATYTAYNSDWISTYNATYAKYAANVSRNYTQQTYDNWGENWYNHTLSTYTIYDSRWYQVLWDATFNASFDDRDSDTTYSDLSEFNDNIFAGINHTLQTYTHWNSDWISTYNATYLAINTTANIQNLLNSTGIYSTYNATYAKYAANVSRNYTQQTYDNWGENWYNHTLSTYTIYDSRWYQVLWDATFNASFDDRDSDTTYSDLSEFNDNIFAGINHTLQTYTHWNSDWITTYNATYVAINTTANIQNLLNSTGIYSTYNATYAKYAANVSRNYTQQTYDNWGENWYNHTLATYTAYNSDWISTYNATYAKYAANVSRNWTQQTYNNWGENWYNHTLSTYTMYDSRWYQVLWDATFNASFDDRDSDTQLSEDNVEAFIFDTDNTANLGMGGYNITAMDCIFFESGGKICSGV